MGCSASKLDNEDTVRRCKDRRRLMKEAVYARHHLAAAHSDYCRSLRFTGSALSDFASNEPLSVSDSTPAVLLRNSSSFSSKSVPLPSKSFSLPSQPPPIRTASSPAPSSVHPPPPPPPYSPSLSSSSTMASSKIPHILSGSSVKSAGNVSRGSGRRRQTDHHSQQAQQQQPPLPPPQLKPLKPKLPHILSDSSISSTPTGTRHAENFGGYDATYAAYPATPSSQASSVWNWEHFYPPSPPESEFFYTRQQQERHQPYQNDAVYYPKKNPHHHDDEIHHLDVESEEERETEREEVHCSEWGDHYSTSTSTTSESEADGDDERETARSEVSEIRSNFGSSTRNGSSIGQQQQQQRRNQHHHQPPTSAKYNGGGMDRVDEKSDDGGGSSSVSWGYGAVGSGGGEVSDMRVVVRHRDLKEIVASIKEYFDKAASAGDQVGEMLETGRAQLDRSFRQLKKTVYHSSGVLSSLSSTWSSKPPLAVKYSLDPGSLDQPGSSKSLCSTLERLLAWEKKLYEEVKARERVRIAHEKKLKTLQSQEYKGENEVKVDKTKSSIKRLQSLIIVTSQAVNTTSSAIVGLRDSDLVPQLVELCHGLMYMWRAMNQSHEFQNQVVQQVRGLVNQSMKGHSTSELHRQATRDLESAVSAWHSSFCCLVQHQREFICSLQSWFKLSLQPVDSEVASLNMVAARSTEAFSFFDEWKLSLDRLPDKVASEAIKSFVNVVHVISSKQAEEIKTKRKTETVSKELEKKASSVRNIERKYYHSYSTVGLGLPDKGDDGSGLGLDARDPLAEKKAELASYQRKVEDEMLKHAKAVEVTRAMTLNNLQTGLPGVFQAMTSFSSLYAESMETVCTRSYAIK